MKHTMKKAIIKETDDLRVVMYLAESLFPFTLEVNDRIKGWVPLMIYDSEAKALEGMAAIIESNRKEGAQ